MKGMAVMESDQPLLIQETTAVLSEWMRMDLYDHSWPQRAMAMKMG